MHKKIIYSVILLLIAGIIFPGVTVAADFAKVGTVGMQTMKIPVGARGVAMGNAFTPLSNDISAMFWNPAGLTYTEKTSAMVERINWLADMGYNAIGVSRKLNDTWAVGAFVTSFNSGDIEETTVEMPEGTGRTFDVTNLVVGVTGAARLTTKFSIGMNLKYVREDLDGNIAGAYSIDVGTLYDTRWKTIRISMNIKDFGPEIQLDGNYYDYDNGVPQDEPTEYLPYHFPMTFRLGFAVDPYVTDMHRITMVAELEHPNDNIERYNVGGEYGFRELFFLRGGYSFGHDTLGLSSGFGMKWRGFGIDYAFSHFGILEAVHRFNVNFNF